MPSAEKRELLKKKLNEIDKKFGKGAAMFMSDAGVSDIKKFFKACDDSEKVLIDVKGLYQIADLKNSGMKYWRL